MLLIRRLLDCCWVVAIALAVLALAPRTPATAASHREGTLGDRSVVGSLDVCSRSFISRAADPPLSALTLKGGDSLFFVRMKNRGRLVWLSRDGYTLRAVGSDVHTGPVAGAVRLSDDGVLIAAEEGLFLLEGSRSLRRFADCDQTGAGQIVMGIDGGVLAFSNGDLLLEATGGLMRLSPQGQLERIADRRGETLFGYQMIGDDALLASSYFGHYLFGRDGRATIIGTGARSRSYVTRREGKPARGFTESFAAAMGLMGLSGATPPSPSGLALVGPDGHATWAKLPSAVRLLWTPIDLEDGRIFLLTDAGLFRLQSDGSVEIASAAIRNQCADDLERLEVRQLADGRSLVIATKFLFTIDRMNRVVVVSRSDGCEVRFDGSMVAATSDGAIYFVKDDALHRAGSDGGAMAVMPTAETGTIYSLKPYGADLLARAKEGVFHTRGEGGMQRLMPNGHQLSLLYSDDIDGRPLICVDETALYRLDSDGKLRPRRAAAGTRCSHGVQAVGSLGLLVNRDEQSHLLITRDDRTIPIQGARVWPVAQLQDGSVVLLTMPPSRHEAGPDPDESATVPRALIRVSSQGRIEPVVFEGPEIRTDQSADPTWLERRQVDAIQFLSPTRGWAIFSGILSATEDAGATWAGVVADGERLTGLSSLSFTADGYRGVAAGKEVIWRTDDGGATWKRMPWSPLIFDIRSIWLVDPEGSRAYAIADRMGDKRITTELLVSNDGGQTWRSQALPIPASVAYWHGGIRAIGFDPSGQTGWLVAADRLLTTSDKGSTWQVLADLRDFRELEVRRWRFEMPKLAMLFGQNLVLSSPEMPVAIAFWGPSSPWCVARGKLFCIAPQDASGVAHSEEVKTDNDVIVLAMAVAGGTSHGWAVGTKGTILATTNGGKSWSAQTSDAGAMLTGVFFLSDARHGWAWGEDGMLLTRDGGMSWYPTRTK